MSKKKLFIFILYTIGVFLFTTFFLGSDNLAPLQQLAPTPFNYRNEMAKDVALSSPVGGMGGSMNIAPQDRLNTLNTSISIYVKSVDPIIGQIQDKAVSMGGFVVTKNESRPTEGGHGYITVRVPREAKNEFLGFVRENALNVLSVTESGDDITAQYYDAEARIKSLDETMRLLRESQAKATNPKDIADIALQMNQIQEQIDFAKGQMDYLEEENATVLITVDLQTDEYALPYNPEDGWSPEKVFKNAVRALNMFIRFLGSALIWAIVFAPIVFIGFALIYLAGKLFDKITRKYRVKE